MSQHMPKMVEDGVQDGQKCMGSVLGSMGQGWGEIFSKFAYLAKPENLENLARTP